MFRRLTLHDWRQFDSVDIELHPRLTVLTGANGAGKTTILNLLSVHFGWNLQFISVPRQTRKGVLNYLSGIWRRVSQAPSGLDEIGSLTYADGASTQINIPSNVSQVFQPQLPAIRPGPGIFIPSHRPTSVYQTVAQIPTALPAREQMFQNYQSEVRNRFLGSSAGYSPAYRIKEALISLATFGYGSEVVAPNEDARSTYEGFERILRDVLPPALGFNRLRIRLPEVVLETRGGDFSFDAVSGGIAAIIDVAWQLYLLSIAHNHFTVVIDEPENHLHPELQRSLFPTFLRAFPSAQFIAATHNPFIVGSVPDSNAYVMSFNEEGRVNSVLLDALNKAGTANEILREALGLHSVAAIWVEERIRQVVDRHLSAGLSREALTAIRQEMASLGLEDLYPSAIDRVIDSAE